MDDLVQQTGMINFWKSVREQLFCLDMEKEHYCCYLYSSSG